MAHAVAGFLRWLFLGVWANSDHLAPWLALFGVAITLQWQNRDRKRDEDRRRNELEEAKAAHDLTTTTRVIGNARTVRSRLGAIAQTGAWPIDQYAQFGRFVDVCYGDAMAETLSRLGTASAFYPKLSGFELAYGSMRYSLDKVAKFASLNSDQALIEDARDDAIAAANGAAQALDVMRRRSATPRTFLKPTFRITNLPIRSDGNA